MQHSKLPEHVALTLMSDPAFTLILERCLEEKEFIEQFERLSGVSRPRAPSSPIIAIVDKVTGYADDQWKNFFSEFIPFVHRCVYEPLLAQYGSVNMTNEIPGCRADGTCKECNHYKQTGIGGASLCARKVNNHIAGEIKR